MCWILYQFFYWKEEHNLSIDKRMWLIFDTKFELLNHGLYEFEVQKPNRKYWGFLKLS